MDIKTRIPIGEPTRKHKIRRSIIERRNIRSLMKVREPLLRVVIEQTGVETVVSESYYNKYARDGVRLLGVYSTGENATPARATLDAVEKPLEDLGYEELKDRATIKGLTFPGNIAKKDLIEMIKEA